MRKVAIVAALEREVSGLTRSCSRVERNYDGRRVIFFERDEVVIVCGGIGVDAARRAAEAAIALYGPVLIQSVGFAGALDAGLRVGDLFMPAVVIDARDGSRVEIDDAARQEQRQATLVTFMAVAGLEQKENLARAYAAQAVDMEAAAVAAAAHAHGILFSATKVISDVAAFEMPGMSRFIDAQGRFRTAKFAAFAALRPWLWPRVAILAGNSRKAARALGKHLDRYLRELNQESRTTAAPSTAGQPAPQAAPIGGLTAGGQE
jgi:adenosylhomocysteine nucleosidase